MNTAMALPGVFAACVLVFAGCSSAGDPTGSESEDIQLMGGFRLPAVRAPSCGGNDGTLACQTDGDCVAVPLGGCCDNGWKTAVNRDAVSAYANSASCQRTRPICPQYVVNDTRVPECNRANHQCTMVAIDDIACGGFIMHPHWCPDGFDCVFGHVPDIPGRCVAVSP
jgi:hypothetical protein